MKKVEVAPRGVMATIVVPSPCLPAPLLKLLTRVSREWIVPPDGKPLGTISSYAVRIPVPVSLELYWRSEMDSRPAN